MLFSEEIFTVDYFIERDALLCQRETSAERIRPWGPNAGAWQQKSGGDWRPSCPALDINLMEQLAAAPSKVPRLGLRRKSRIAACQFLLNAWPMHAREPVRRFPHAHWELLMFLNDGGDAATDLLETNPALAFLAATFAFAERGTGNSTLPTLLSQKRRALASKFGYADAEASVRVLQKIPPSSVTQPLLDTVREALKDPRSERVLLHATQISPALLTVIRNPALSGRFSPTSLRQLERIGPDLPQLDVIFRLEKLAEQARLRNLPVPMIRSLRDIDDAYRPPPPGQTGKPVRYHKGPFPDPPVPETTAIRALRSRQALKKEGAEMSHCIGTNSYYAWQILYGTVYAYRVLWPQRLTLAIRKTGDTWRIGELKGPHDAAPGRFAVNAIEKWLSGESLSKPLPGAPVNPRGPQPVQLSFEF